MLVDYLFQQLSLLFVASNIYFPYFSITAASTIDDSELSELLRQDANNQKANAANAKVDP